MNPINWDEITFDYTIPADNWESVVKDGNILLEGSNREYLAGKNVWGKKDNHNDLRGRNVRLDGINHVEIIATNVDVNQNCGYIAGDVVKLNANLPKGRVLAQEKLILSGLELTLSGLKNLSSSKKLTSGGIIRRKDRITVFRTEPDVWVLRSPHGTSKLTPGTYGGIYMVSE